jgi:3-hydroxybutyryl-CoA dehydrogenase
MKIEDIHKVLIVGTGTMGQKIALQCARSGYDVVAYDAVPKSLENAKSKIPAFAAALVDKGEMTPEASAAALSRIRYSSDPKDGADADLLNESVFEDVELKRRVFAQFNTICKPETIFTTNTSTLLPSMYAEATGRPAQFAALHFYGVFDHNLADVMAHPGTAPEILDLLTAFARRIRQVPVVLKREHPGFLGNALVNAMTHVAFRIALIDKIATVEDVDRSVMLTLGTDCGPFGRLDLVGLDTVWHIMQSDAKLSDDPRDQALADDFKREFIDKGWLGLKSGRGFYTYPNPAWSRPGFLGGDSE